jgi:hypothetical protein
MDKELDEELALIHKVIAVIDERRAAGAPKSEIDKLEDDLQELQSNYYLGKLFEEDE